MGFVTRSAPAYGGVRRFVKLVLGGWPASSSSDSVYGGRRVIRRVLSYLAAIAAVGVVSLGLAGLAWVLGIARVETFLLIFVLLVGAIAWRLGRGPAIAAILAIAVVADYFFISPAGAFALGSVSDVVRLASGILAAAAVIQFVYVSRRRQLLLQRRKDLLQDVSPRIIQSLDAEEVLNTVAEATLRVIDYQHFRLYRWDESSERLILVKSVARAASYEHTDWHTVTLSLGEGLTGIAAQSRRSLLVPDGSVDSRMVYPAGTTRIPESIISVPMVTRDRLFGVLSLARKGARSLSAEDLRLMESIAAQTALALANAEQYAEAEQTIKALATIEALQPAESGLTDAEVDNRIVEGFVDLSQADFATLRLLQPDGRYHVGATGGRLWPDNEAPTGPPLTADQVAWLADPRVTVYVADPEGDTRIPDWARRGTQLAGVKASVFLPMRAGQRFVGFVGLYWRRPRWLRSEQLRRLQLVAAQAAIAVDTRQALERERGRAEALVEMERARREFMQIASHELRTPLTVIRGYASLLEEGSLGQMPPAAQRAIRTLMDKSSEMRAQVERMLLLARLEDGAAAQQMTELDLRTVVRDAVERVRPQVALKQGTVNVALAPAPLTIVGDPDRLATAVDNLLQNAVKFSAGPPEIEVTGDREDGRVRLVVKDHGIGIPASARSHLFEKFYRVNDPELNNVVGTGIGLYLVRQVVEGHGGRVEVASEPGHGSTFEVELPVAVEAASAPARPAIP
jgi:signal transduction histidine kinase/putative methionine-R-sulfoxide reductase with GAF domain